jgi:hypothetical protein
MLEAETGINEPLLSEGRRHRLMVRHGQMMGALEATDGMLLFGISTAFIFTAMQAHWPMLIRLPSG